MNNKLLTQKGEMPIVLAGFAISIFLLLMPRFSFSAMITPSDGQITEAIKRSLSINFNERYSLLVDIKTKDGIVTLSGVVDNLLTRERAVLIAQTIQGVRAVVSQIHISRINRPDQEIEKNLKKAIEEDPVTESYQIDFSVHEGIVTLNGKVDSYQEKFLATQVAKGVKGVRKVNNKIKPAPKEHRLDEEIKAEIKRRLKLNVWIFDGGITVNVENGKVSLTGTIGSEAEKNRVRYNSWVTGVKEIDDLGLAINTFIRSEDLRKTKPVSLEDDEIRDAVNEVLALDPRVKPAGIKIKVSDGIVRLEGTVKHFLIKKAAEQDASNTVGVKKIINNIKVSLNGSPNSDEALAKKIKNALANHPLTGDVELETKVKDKKVNLHGEVSTLYEKALVEQVVSSVRGVENIDNQLSVLFSWPKKNDKKIREDIQNLISWSLFVNGENILVSVENGAADLSGKVFDWKGVHRAVEKGFQGGAKIVKTDLTLDNGEVAKAEFNYRDIRVGL
ncbi:MAG: hypothetical protein NPINA01_23090 [Nitrospinaceae bacterium]|nr:MAG: hypothetical protein NPINA01_23090 [Nitrospinaceae bacterium]